MAADATTPFYYAHYADIVGSEATPSTTATEESAYPLTRATDFSYEHLADPAMLEETSGRIVWDFGSAQRIDGVVLWTNFIEDLQYSVQGHTADSWATPTVSTGTKLAPAKRADGFTRRPFTDVRLLSNYSESGLRYWSVNVISGNDAPVGLKVIFLQRIRQLERDFQWGVEDTEHQFAIDMTTDAGYPWAYSMGSAPRLLRGGKLDTDVDGEAVREWFRSCQGIVRPTVVVPEPTNPDDAWIGRWSLGALAVRQPSVVVARLATRRQFADANVREILIEEFSSCDPEWS